jgi:putative ABC transport system substrate-binding protein
MSMPLDVLILGLLLVFAPTTFVAVSGGAARAQQPQSTKVYRIGFLRQGQPAKDWVEAFQQGLRERGYVDGQNVVVEYRFTDGSVDQLARLAEELVRLKVDVIVTSAAPAALAAKKMTTSVPIVAVSVIDPVELGLVRSLGRPGGNITGLTDSGPDVAGEAPGAAERARAQAQASCDALACGESGQSPATQEGGGRSAHARPAA